MSKREMVLTGTKSQTFREFPDSTTYRWLSGHVDVVCRFLERLRDACLTDATYVTSLPQWVRASNAREFFLPAQVMDEESYRRLSKRSRVGRDASYLDDLGYALILQR
jgi:hypothetical protein